MHEAIPLHYKTEDQTLLQREYSCISFMVTMPIRHLQPYTIFLNLAFWGSSPPPRIKYCLKSMVTENLEVEEDTEKT